MTGLRKANADHLLRQNSPALSGIGSDSPPRLLGQAGRQHLRLVGDICSKKAHEHMAPRLFHMQLPEPKGAFGGR